MTGTRHVSRLLRLGEMMDYAVLFQRLYGRPPVGVGDDQLARAEERLSTVIPTPLRALYLACGREECVTASHNLFSSPDELYLADGRLVFCEENQTVCVWGCVPSQGDPAAEVANVLREGVLEWHPEEVGLSRFLEIMVYLQTAWGGFEYVGDLQEPERAMPKIEADWEKVVRHNGLTIYAKPGVLISALDGQSFLTAAARTPERFSWLQRELGFEPL